MTRFADPTRCPDCGAPVPPSPERCTRCDLPLTGPDAGDLFRTLQHADVVLDRMRLTARVPVGAGAGPASVGRAAVGEAPARASYAPFPEPFPLPPGPRAVAPAPGGRSGLSQASVPKILLGLGALCLLVAAVVFLALAWSVLGVGGRTAVLVGVTVAAGACSALAAGRGLRAAAESLAAVAAGLLVLDLVGADNAGWFGALEPGALTILVGVVLAGVGYGAAELAVRSRALPRLGVAELVAALGVLLVAGGALLLTEGHVDLVLVAGVVATAGAAALARLRRLQIAAAAALAGAGAWWLALLTRALVRAGEHASYGELWGGLWGGLEVWPLVAAAALATAPVLARRLLDRYLRIAAALVGALVLTLAIGLPLPQLQADLRTGIALAAVVAAALATYVVAGAWRVVPAGVLALAWLIPVAELVRLGGIATERVLPSGVWTEAATVRLAEPVAGGDSPLFLVPLALALVVSAVALGRFVGETLPVLRAAACPVVALLVLALAGTVASYAVPLALVLVLVVLAALVLGGWSLTLAYGVGDAASERGSEGSLLAGLLATLTVLLGALLVALVSTWLTAAVLLALTAGAAALGLVRDRGARLLGEVCLPPAAAALLWTVCDLVSIAVAERGVAVLLLLGALAIVRPRLTTEVPAPVVGALAAGVGIAAADDPSWWLAIDLTVAGTLVVLTSLVHAQRRVLAPVGGLLLAMASWVRLADLGVGTPEAYTLPSALVLLVVGLWHVLKHPESGTRRTLAPGLLLALVPSLLWSLADPVSWRALALGVACLALVLAGAALRWSAPLSVGAGTGAVLVLRELAPYAEVLPQWALIGLAGTLLTFVGVTWESRVKQLRATGAYLERLR
ncbi:SCO7613 C-terminal domain-containing membrane protein [Nocardioides pacificus]